MPPQLVPFRELAGSDLHRDWLYEAGSAGNYGDEPIHHMIPVGNQGGIRYAGTVDDCRLIALFSTLEHDDWPDRVDDTTGVVTYFGDNRTASRGALDPKGNRLLREIFRPGFASASVRAACPPILVFTNANEPDLPKRSQLFRGLAVPGADGTPAEDWLVMKWFDTASGRFENYQLVVTLLDVATVTRRWIASVLAGRRTGHDCPEPYAEWVRTGSRARK